MIAEVAPRGIRISSTRSGICFGGGGVNLLIINETTKFKIIPSVPMPSGDMPNHQCSLLLSSGFMNLK